MTHTPGPWKVGGVFGDEIHTDADRRIASINTMVFDCGDNARLIAAAPELVQELREIVGRFEAMCSLTRTTGRIADTSHIHALLARIEGR